MQNYFSRNYFSGWFPKHYFILLITEEPVKKGEAGGSYLLPGETLFPDNVNPTIIRINKAHIEIELTNAISQIYSTLETDEEEAIILIQILSELPNYHMDQYLQLNKENLNEIFDIIDIANNSVKKQL